MAWICWREERRGLLVKRVRVVFRVNVADGEAAELASRGWCCFNPGELKVHGPCVLIPRGGEAYSEMVPVELPPREGQTEEESAASP